MVFKLVLRRVVTRPGSHAVGVVQYTDVGKLALGGNKCNHGSIKKDLFVKWFSSASRRLAGSQRALWVIGHRYCGGQTEIMISLRQIT